MAVYDKSLINEGKSLINTFTVHYDVPNYSNDYFSSTYDELSIWMRKLLKEIELKEIDGRDGEFYKYIRTFRGRVGDVTLVKFKDIINNLN